MGIFSKIKSSLKKTSEVIARSLTGRKIDEHFAQEIEDALLMADVGVEASAELSSKIAHRKFSKDSSNLEVLQFLATEMTGLLKPYERNFFEELSASASISAPEVVLMIGVNGNGKTTTAAKMASLFKEKGHRPLLVAADTFRAAAMEQLEYWAKKIDVDIHLERGKTDAAGVVFSAIERAKNNGNSIVIVDTAGRMQNRNDLLAELEKIKRVTAKLVPDTKCKTVLIIDGLTGQAAHSQADTFLNKIGVDGIIVTKLDGTAKGGVILSIVKKYQIPILAIGIGEKIQDLKQFSAREYCEAILGI
ncbi:MAG: signal recognition particle-docking protein FtsY [Holosporaceae bacterium]|nr:signal recognition particle-docking protein FtsY [Holosporaceae bacterium]